MSAQVYSVPGESLTCGGNGNYYKSVHHPIPTVSVEIGNTLAIF